MCEACSRWATAPPGNVGAAGAPGMAPLPLGPRPQRKAFEQFCTDQKVENKSTAHYLLNEVLKWPLSAQPSGNAAIDCTNLA